MRSAESQRRGFSRCLGTSAPGPLQGAQLLMQVPGFLIAVVAAQSAAGDHRTVRAEEVTFQVPRGWEDQPAPRTPLIASFLWAGPSEGPEGTVRETLRVTIMPYQSWTKTVDDSFAHLEVYLKETARGTFNAAGHRILWRESQPREQQSPFVRMIDYHLLHGNREYRFRFMGDERRIDSLRPTFESIVKSLGPSVYPVQTSREYDLSVRIGFASGIAVAWIAVFALASPRLLKKVKPSRGRLFIWLALPLSAAYIVLQMASLPLILGDGDLNIPYLFAILVVIAFVTMGSLLAIRKSAHGLLARIPDFTKTEFASILTPLIVACSGGLLLPIAFLLAALTDRGSVLGTVLGIILPFGCPVVSFAGMYWLSRRLKLLIGPAAIGRW